MPGSLATDLLSGPNIICAIIELYSPRGSPRKNGSFGGLGVFFILFSKEHLIQLGRDYVTKNPSLNINPLQVRPFFVVNLNSFTTVYRDYGRARNAFIIFPTR